ncbi:MAG: hypothetical protein PHC88_11195 [Terrimicrobiaceae bacterium]|nr:hypothetical protein [Terrimicrobiaceae bacterium]
MLAELYNLAKNLRKTGAAPSPQHRDIDDVTFNGWNNIRVTINHKAEIVRISAITAADRVAIWTMGKGQKRYLPAARTSVPLILLPPASPLWAQIEKPTAVLLATILADHRASVIAPSMELQRQVASRLQALSHAGDSAGWRIVEGFATAFLTLTSDSSRFRDSLLVAVENALGQPEDRQLFEALRSLITGKMVVKKGKRTLEVAAQMVFDYTPENEIVGALHTFRIKRLVTESLLNAEASPRGKDADKPGIVECAFEQKPLKLLDGPFAPWVVRKQFTSFQPYAKDKDTPCFFRYGRVGSNGFPIGQAVAQQISEAACEITNESSFGKTWRSMRNGRFKRNSKGRPQKEKDLLVIYPSFPSEDLRHVDLLCRPNPVDESEDDQDIVASNQTFRQVSEAYCSALSQLVPEDQRNKHYMRILLLRRVNRGSVQLVCERTPSCAELNSAIKNWCLSDSNLPRRLEVPLPSKNAERGFGWLAPNLLFPDDAIQVFSHQWMRGGAESSRLQTPPASAILDVFLQREGVWQDTARQLLETLLPRVEPLLIGAGNILHRSDRQNIKAWMDMAPKTEAGQLGRTDKPDPRYYLAKSLSLIGTLLHALNSTPNHYMKETAYLTGKLLAAMDELHKCYCIAERKPRNDGSPDIPPTLIGNGLLGRAADSPEMALDELRERSRIYLGWARAVQHSGKETEAVKIAINSARKLLRIVEPIAADLHQSTNLKQPLSTEGKAHLFLGYLSPVLGGKKDSDEAPTEPTQPA